MLVNQEVLMIEETQDEAHVELADDFEVLEVLLFYWLGGCVALAVDHCWLLYRNFLLGLVQNLSQNRLLLLILWKFLVEKSNVGIILSLLFTLILIFLFVFIVKPDKYLAHVYVYLSLYPLLKLFVTCLLRLFFAAFNLLNLIVLTFLRMILFELTFLMIAKVIFDSVS